MGDEFYNLSPDYYDILKRATTLYNDRYKNYRYMENLKYDFIYSTPEWEWAKREEYFNSCLRSRRRWQTET